jgi:hypothetical protein
MKTNNLFQKAFLIGAAFLITAGAWSINGASSVAQTIETNSGSVFNRRPPTVPETNAGIVLLPFFVVAILISSKGLLRPQSAQEK